MARRIRVGRWASTAVDISLFVRLKESKMGAIAAGGSALLGAAGVAGTAGATAAMGAAAASAMAIQVFGTVIQSMTSAVGAACSSLNGAFAEEKNTGKEVGQAIKS
jgi:hypothetical protein